MPQLSTLDMFKLQLSRKGSHTLTDDEVSRVQDITYSILCDVADLASRLNIPIMLGGGTALGAVRHEGFIPWDDDVDINVERRHIKRLLDAIEEELGDKYLVMAPDRTPDYIYTFCQVQKRGTTFRESLSQKDGECGIKIDIWILENTYDNPILRFFHGIGCDFNSLILSCIRIHDRKEEYLALAEGNSQATSSIKLKSILGAPFSPFLRHRIKAAQKCFSRCRDNGSKFVTFPSGRKHFFGELYQRSEYCKTIPFKFRDRIFQVPSGYDAYFKALYGEDYMTPPPPEKREAHVIYDLDFEGPVKLGPKEFQQELLKATDEFDLFCTEHGLTWYLVGGSLLGAFRHSGFIPWDDDIDIGMPRADYDRFIKLTAADGMTPDIGVISGDLGTYTLPFAELVIKDITVSRGSTEYILPSMQIFKAVVDVFPQDAWPSEDNSCIKTAKTAEKYLFKIRMSRARLGRGTSFVRKIGKTFAVIPARIVGNRRYNKKFIQYAKSFGDYGTARYVGSITYAIDGMGERCDGASARKIIRVPFEDRNYPIPMSYDEYLTGKYGDYMNIPPESQRKTHEMEIYKANPKRS